MSAVRNLVGLKVGRLSVIDRAGSSSKGRALWRCRCECGSEKVVLGTNLVGGRSTSCGCLTKERTREVSSENNRKHGLHGTPTYRSWRAMKSRCSNPNRHDRHIYLARGIKVCDRWLRFENFLADMGERPDGTSLDRIDNDGHYEPGNCRWATPKEQRANQRVQP